MATRRPNYVGGWKLMPMFGAPGRRWMRPYLQGVEGRPMLRLGPVIEVAG